MLHYISYFIRSFFFFMVLNCSYNRSCVAIFDIAESHTKNVTNVITIVDRNSVAHDDNNLKL
jgi:hypothetical protein